MENGVALDMACERQFFVNRSGVCVLLFLFFGIVRSGVHLSANRKLMQRYMARFAIFPVVHNGFGGVENLLQNAGG